MSGKIQGRIKWYNGTKGYGFLEVTGREKDVFFHAKAWNAVSSTPPVDGETIAFTEVAGPKGAFATELERKGA